MLALLVVGIAGLIAALYYHDQTKTRTVRGSSSIEFITGQAPGKKKRPRRVVKETPWPQYGYDAGRSHFAADFRHRPPFRRLWAVETHQYIEFPPSVADNRVFVASAARRVLRDPREDGQDRVAQGLPKLHRREPGDRREHRRPGR